MALRFPKDNQQDYQGRITFRSFAPPVPEVSLSGMGDLFTKTKDAFRNPDLGLSPGAFGGRVEVGDRTNYLYGTRSNKRNYSGQRVSLYLPQALAFRDAADYNSGIELGVIGGTAEAAVNQGQNIGAVIAGAATQSLSTFNDLISGNTGLDQEASRLASARVARKFGGETGGNVAGSTLRVAVNPNKRTLFRSVNLREFSFTFKMIANSADEAEEIDKIIKFFRTELYPSTTGGGTELIGYNFPNLFDIEMTYNNQKVATKIKPVYLKDIGTTYNPGNMGYHVDGKASEVDIALNFIEERTLNKQDIVEGF